MLLSESSASNKSEDDVRLEQQRLVEPLGREEEDPDRGRAKEAIKGRLKKYDT